MAGLGVPRQQANWAGQSRDFLRGAGSSYAQMQREEKSTSTTEAPGKTAGGAITSGVGMGLAGGMAASSGALGGTAATAGTAATGAAAMATPIGIGFGLLGLGAYLFS